MKTPFRSISVWIALFALVFAQLALAAHACAFAGQAMPSGEASTIVSASDCCEDVNADSSLCHTHCNQDGQALEKPDPLSIPLAASSGFAVAAHPVDFGVGSVPTLRRAPFLERSIEPRITIRNCCFRI